MTLEIQLRSAAPASLASARAMAHRAAQHLTRIARANLPAAADDSHSNIGWDRDLGAFKSHAMDGNFVGLSLASLTLFVTDKDGGNVTLPLQGCSDEDAAAWLDGEVVKAGLKGAAGLALPYELPEDAAQITTYQVDAQTLKALTAWFDLASQTLEEFAANNTALEPGPSAVRCWPHHFDIATYVALETGDPETARGVGVGMSPGDEGYNEPYFYINAWPHLDTSKLPDAIDPGHWHTAGYVGSIATATELLSTVDAEQMTKSFVHRSFAASLTALGLWT